jgi:hypothetical protein
MTYDQTRALAKATKLRDWGAIDRIIEDLRVCGSMAVLRGLADARKHLGEEPAMPPIKTPNVLTIHDLSPEGRAKAEIKVTAFCGVHKLVVDGIEQPPSHLQHRSSRRGRRAA